MLIYRWQDGRPAEATDHEENTSSDGFDCRGPDDCTATCPTHHPGAVREIEVEIHADRHEHIWGEADGEEINLTSSETEAAWRELASDWRSAREDAAMERSERW